MPTAPQAGPGPTLLTSRQGKRPRPQPPGWQPPDQSGADWFEPKRPDRNYTDPPLEIPVVTPLRADEFERRLANFPNRALANWLVRSLREGFDMGDNFPELGPHRCRNRASALAEPAHMTTYAEEETAARRWFPVLWSCHPRARNQPLGTTEKQTYGGPRKLRTTKDLSAEGPEGISINGSIDLEQHPIKYIGPLDLAEVMMYYGAGCSFSLFDIVAAYRNCPVSPATAHLHLIEHQGVLYADVALSFGGGSSCKLFDSLMICIHWIVQEQINAELGSLDGGKPVCMVLHMLDDIGLVAPNKRIATAAADIVVRTMDALGVPNSIPKMAVATQREKWLGVVLDSNQLQVSLPPDKGRAYHESSAAAATATSISYGELETLLGRWGFADNVHPAIRPFVSPGYLLLHRLGDNKHHHIKTTLSFRLAARVWSVYLAEAPPRQMQWPIPRYEVNVPWPECPLQHYWFCVGDASGATGRSDGFGFFHRQAYACLPWQLGQRPDLDNGGATNSQYIECFCLVAAVATLITQFGARNCTIVYYTDSQALAGAASSKRRCPTAITNDLLCVMALLCEVHDLEVEVVWRPRDDPFATIADALSHCDPQALESTTWGRGLPCTTPTLPPQLTRGFVEQSLGALRARWARRQTPAT